MLIRRKLNLFCRISEISACFEASLAEEANDYFLSERDASQVIRSPRLLGCTEDVGNSSKT